MQLGRKRNGPTVPVHPIAQIHDTNDEIVEILVTGANVRDMIFGQRLDEYICL